MDPIKCPACGTKFHDEAERKNRRLIWWVMIVAIISMLAGIIPGLRFLFYFGVFLSVLSFGLIAYDEIYVIKVGVLTKTTLQKQKKDLKIIFISLALIIFGILYEIYKAL